MINSGLHWSQDVLERVSEEELQEWRDWKGYVNSVLYQLDPKEIRTLALDESLEE